MARTARQSLSRGGRVRSERRAKARKKLWNVGAATFIFLLAVCLLLAILSVRVAVIPSTSMLPTLQVGQHVVVNLWSGRFMPVNRGDIVVFEDPGDWLAESETGYSNLNRTTDTLTGVDSNGLLIKRVIGLPGDTVAYTDNVLTVNAEVVDEPYLYDPASKSNDFSAVVPEDSFWVMGDNRSGSNDSRYHGAVPVSALLGRAYTW